MMDILSSGLIHHWLTQQNFMMYFRDIILKKFLFKSSNDVDAFSQDQIVMFRYIICICKNFILISIIVLALELIYRYFHKISN